MTPLIRLINYIQGINTICGIDVHLIKNILAILFAIIVMCSSSEKEKGDYNDGADNRKKRSG